MSILPPIPDTPSGFFFTSTRRHTRWTGDWSSDVCSSDLRTATGQVSPATAFADRKIHREFLGPNGSWNKQRSEERRVGKECRSRWWPEDWHGEVLSARAKVALNVNCRRLW